MYNFLMIKIVPSYVREIFTEMLKFMYNKGDIFSWLPQSVQLKQNFFSENV